MTAETAEILTRVNGTVGFVTLNRPTAINSLTHPMVTRLRQVLTEWAEDGDITAVVLDGAGERGLCAGGDIVAIYHDIRDEGGAKTRRFWYDEYLLNGYISRYPKPYVSLMDGIVMGGGVGVGAHGNTRVVTETTKLAMPEVGIGFIPDVGGTYLLSRAPGSTGLHAALTGAPMSGADAIALGFADHYVPHDALTGFTATIVADGVGTALSAYAVTPPPSAVAQKDWIDDCYAGQTIAEIVSCLRRHDARLANGAADTITARSPIALAVTLEAVRRAGALGTLEDVLAQEYRTSCAALDSHDFVEGIRAMVIDKDRKPKWSPASMPAVTASDVEAYFTGVDVELTF
ncbi:enoyl-CoA hydratase/isomerase family protein [Mycolicibacterium stellerae]|uniref:enoyl-CoA hydratase/isomerase family protein n=1 Tax=Mycolicibacterium stellerae TaxID=2358193 RepID=UPI000F0BBC17|nr:enoyl-CoA hydratase/isomerase family protein [Mycolicibacterium stellerae]